MTEWQPSETSTHQDAVVAHILGATVLGYWIDDETIHLLLDMGFIWTIYLDGQMVLLPHPVAVSELTVDERTRSEISGDIDQLLSSSTNISLQHFSVPIVRDEIREVEFYEFDEQRQIRIGMDGGRLLIESNLEQGLLDLKYE